MCLTVLVRSCNVKYLKCMKWVKVEMCYLKNNSCGIRKFRNFFILGGGFLKLIINLQGNSLQ